MKDKKILIIFSLITLALILSLTLIDKNKEKEGVSKGVKKIQEKVEDIKEGNKVKAETREGTEEKKEVDEIVGDEKVNIEKNGDSIYLKTSSNSISPITSLKWKNNNTLSFNYTYEDKGNLENNIYDYDISNGQMNKKHHITGAIWEWKDTKNDGIIYTEDGFNGLYYMDSNGNKRMISKKQEWYNISPDGQKVIINGIIEGSSDSLNKRFIYDVEEKKMVEAEYIPDMEYTFSYIAATWSNDSTHIVSQLPQISNQVNIINVNKGIEKEIKIADSIITDPIWSTNGEKLAFLIQSSEYDKYVFDNLETKYYLSDKIGIYDVKSKEVEIIELDNRLTTSSVYWSEGSNGIIIESTKVDNAKKLLQGSLEKINGEVQYINIDTKEKNVIVKDALDINVGYPNHKITPLKLFDNDVFIYLDGAKNIKSINILNTDTENLISKEVGYIYDYLRKGDIIYLVSDEGIFTIDSKLKINDIIEFKSYYGNDLLNVDVKISPKFERVALYVQYNQENFKPSFIEIKNLQ